MLEFCHCCNQDLNIPSRISNKNYSHIFDMQNKSCKCKRTNLKNIKIESLKQENTKATLASKS